MSPTQKKIAIPLAVFISVGLALMGWQWNTQGRLTTVEVKQEVEISEVKEALKELKSAVNQNYLMNSRKLDSIAQDVNKLNVKMETKVDKRWIRY